MAKIYIGGHRYNTNTSLIFKDNELVHGGSVMIIKAGIYVNDFNSLAPPRFLVYNSEFTFDNNKIFHNGDFQNKYMAVLLIMRSKVASTDTSLLFVGNSVPTGGIFALLRSALLVDGDFYAKFENNEGSDGGAMTFQKMSYIDSDVTSNPGKKVSAHFIFSNNLAHKRGGAIFVEDMDYIESSDQGYNIAFFLGDHEDFKLKFDLFNNTAKVSGNEVYGGWIDCISNAEFNITFSDYHAVSSEPLRICMCVNSSPDCVTEKEVSTFPGQKFEIEAVAVGQRYGIVPYTVAAELLNSSASLEQEQDVQSVGKECTKLHYAVYSNQIFENVKLTVERQIIKTLFKIQLTGSLPAQYHAIFEDFIIRIRLRDCLLGFILDTDRHMCQCLPEINAHSGVFCDSDNYYIIKTEHWWLSAPTEHGGKGHGVIIHDFCPYNYCKQLAKNEIFSFHLESPDDQRAFNRSGVLCGECQQNLSQIFGTSKCKKCSNFRILFLNSWSFDCWNVSGCVPNVPKHYSFNWDNKWTDFLHKYHQS